MVSSAPIDLKALSALYWRYLPAEQLTDRSPDDLAAEIQTHLELAAVRVPGQVLLRIRNPEPETAPSVIEIATDDMPFLVDSVTAALAQLGVAINMFNHPQPVVRRDLQGQLLDVRVDADPDAPQAGDLVESWMRIEVNRLAPDDAQAIEERLLRVLGDVREAVEDWAPMRAKALAIADELASADLPVPEKDVLDSRALLQWLVDDQFTFLGYRDYRLVHADDGDYLESVPGTGLGILRAENAGPRKITQLPQQVRDHLLEPRLLIITKANSRSTVHRSAYMDYIGLKVFDSAGKVVGERRFLGLFSSSAYFQSVRNLPVISRKAEEVIQRSGLSMRSYSGKDLLSILETYPRDELFQVRTEELFDTVMSVLQLQGKRSLRLFARRDMYGRFVSCMVYLPRDRYNTRTRIKMQEVLVKAFDGVGVDYTARVSEGTLARVRFVVRVEPHSTMDDVDVPALQAKLIEVTRWWEEDFSDALLEAMPSDEARRLFDTYAQAFGEGYKAETRVTTAVADVLRLDQLTEKGQIAVHLHANDEKSDDEILFTIYQRGDGMPLSQVLPVLQSLGVRVLHERPYQVDDRWVYEYGLALAPGTEEDLDLQQVGRAVEDAFTACWRGDAEVDGFNELVLKAGLTWDQIVVLRAYARYFQQAGTRYSQNYMQQALAKHPNIARALVSLFDAKFNPEFSGDSAAAVTEQQAVITDGLDSVDALDDDRIIRAFMLMINGTLRTNHYRRDEHGNRRQYLSLKFDSESIPFLPKPHPKYEIFVYSPKVEGVHLRFGRVARGGLRWSDRHEDFRTEVLGLVKAQMVKNAIIVPTGSKGGFVVKQPPVGGDRAAQIAEGIACYKLFISGLLDITDNLVAGKIVPPSNVVRHDGDDSYLVVAADKGTATFSDIANEVAQSYGFWLGDAFASGGSYGYDHKKMGITARGAWESVKRHFRQLGVDTQSQDFTVAGVGDMSGDVFGNGMLLSQHIRLVAAFDHRHIFLDPNPDAATSYAERQRLFDLPSSSWADYDSSLISAGGGVFARSLKSIPLSEQVREALGTDATELSPAELIQAILRAPVDLLWNGGIGTYVKASTELHSQAGDKSNDATRVDATELRCKVVGEGGNLGLTQLGRIEFALSGGRINTDAIDNSAGVDTSDHEVNMKILFSLAEGLSFEDRNTLMGTLTDEVAELVLRNNYAQNNALMLGTHLAPKLVSVHRRLITEMEREGRLDRPIEFLPSDDEIAEREVNGGALSSPELSVVLAYVKIGLKEDILASDLPDDPACAALLHNYFPAGMREKFADLMADHPLKREIIATSLVNNIVDHGGLTFVYRAAEETGASSVDVARAYLVIRGVFDLDSLWAQNEALDNKVDVAAQLAVSARLRRVLDRGVRWLLQTRGGTIDVRAEIERLGGGVAELLPTVGEFFVGHEVKAVRGYIETLTELGVPASLAVPTVNALHGFGLLDVVELAQQRDLPPLVVAKVYFTASERFAIADLLERISGLPRHDRWTALARMAIRYDLYAVLAGITADVLARAGERVTSASAEALLDEWVELNRVRIERVASTLNMLTVDAKPDLATLSVLLRQLRSLVSA
ncbi:MAG: NAD-glutamate dehydrogenase [Corynebacteriales bacterium]|nr:NAD-glutamate dehydrogenase [Mycobacteriales bacterium]